MLENNQVLENEVKEIPVKKSPVVEIDLQKGEKRKLSLLSFKGKVALSVILMIYLLIGLIVAAVVAVGTGDIYLTLLIGAIILAVCIAYPVSLAEIIRKHKRRYLLKSNNLSEIIDYLDCPNYEERVRVVEEDKNISLQNDEEDYDYYDEYEYEEIEDESTSYVQSFEEIDFEEMVLDIVKFAGKKGLSTDVGSVRTFMSAINSSHLIEIKSKNLEVSKKFVDILSEYLTRKAHYVKENQSWESPEDIMWKKHNNVLVETEILKSVLHASKNKNRFTFLGLVDVHYSKLESYFAQFLTFVNYPNRRLLVEVSEKFNNGIDPAGKVAIPKNLWFIIFPKQNVENKVPTKIAKNLVSIEISGSIIEAEDVEVTKEDLLIDQFEYSVNKSADESDISEELWKKYDEFLKKIEELEVNLELNDKYFYGIEKYATMYTSTGADEAQAVDNVINSKILPLLLNKKDLNVDQINLLIRWIEEIFDTEGFTVTLKTLNKLKEN